MDKERTKIDQKLCDTVRMMMAGKDAKVSQVVELLGISQATVNRIRQAGYSLEQFNKDKSSRNERKNELKGQKQAEEQEKEEQVPGQISMDLHPAEEQEKYKTTELIAPIYDGTPLNMMRFQAKQADKIRADIVAVGDENAKAIYELKMEMSKIRDLLSQVLKRMDR